MFERLQCLHYQGQAVQDNCLTLKVKALQPSEASGNAQQQRTTYQNTQFTSTATVGHTVLHQYSKTVTHFLFNLLRIKGLYMFQVWAG
jgi:hypothetical protein